MKAKILIVEDEKNLGDTLKEYLTSIGYDCHRAWDCKSAQLIYKQLNPSTILMDIGLPDGSGLDLAREFRKSRKDFVLLFLSAQNDPDIRVAGLEIGAEDYITKPFALKELTLRLERILKSQNRINSLPEEIEIGKLKIWFKRYEALDGKGNIVALSRKECEILELLFRNQNEAVERSTILDNIWGEEAFPSNRTVDNYIVGLRKWCESDPAGSIQIQSIRGVGYKLTIN